MLRHKFFTFLLSITVVLLCSTGVARSAEQFPSVGDEPSFFERYTNSAQDLILKGLELVGINYRRGGTNPDSGLDCSGFVQVVFRDSIGKLLPRTAKEQSEVGNVVDKDELKPGDLVFFTYSEAGDTEHVALVEYCTTDADGKVTLHVIEGNNPSSVQHNAYSLDNSQVLGFGTCEDVVDTTLRFGCSGEKVLVLQKRLAELGYLAEKDQTGTYGGNTKAAVVEYQKAMKDQPVSGIADRRTQQAIEAAIREKEYNTPDTWLVDE